MNPIEQSLQQLPYVAFDLDGTLAEFDFEKWSKDTGYIGKPIQRVMDMIKGYIAKGVDVKIFTARAEFEADRANIAKWLVDNGLPELEITNVKTYAMVKLYDDNCVQIFSNQGIGYNDIFTTIVQPIVKMNKADVMKRMDKIAKSSAEGRALAKVLERLFKFVEWI